MTRPADVSSGLQRPGPLLTITVHGQPKPKGSMRHVGKGRMIEQLEGSAPWREAVKWAALTEMEMARRALRPLVSPFDGPLAVEVIVTVPKPKSAPKRKQTWPVTRTFGDVDKHLRNILDALQDAGVMGDDSQFVHASVRKAFPGEGDDALPTPGAVIRIWEVT